MKNLSLLSLVILYIVIGAFKCTPRVKPVAGVHSNAGVKPVAGVHLNSSVKYPIRSEVHSLSPKKGQ